MKNNVVKIVFAGLLASAMLCAPVFAQDGGHPEHAPKHHKHHVKHHKKAHHNEEHKDRM
jgi:hypothetical protein